MNRQPTFITPSLQSSSAFSTGIMGNFKHPYHQIASQFNHFRNPSKTAGVLLSLSVLSIILSLTSLLPVLLHSFHVCIFSFPMKLFGYGFGKSYMFLLCNGLLVFIVKNSGLVRNSPAGDDLNEEHVTRKEASRPSAPELENTAMDGSENVREEVEEEKGMANRALATVDERENGLTLHYDEGEEEVDDGCHSTVEEEEDEEGEESGLMSAEEFNRRCDIFIRKVKAEIRNQIASQNSYHDLILATKNNTAIVCPVKKDAVHL